MEYPVYKKSASGNLIYVVTSEKNHQIIGHHKSDKTGQITIQAEFGNEMAVKLILENKELKDVEYADLYYRLLAVLRDTIRTCKKLGAEVPGMDESLKFINEKV